MPSLSFLTAVAAIALPLATSVSATSHYSHPRLTRSHQRAVSRALPRSGRRLVARGAEATLKCLTDYTFALCDGSNCTDMGSVAAGTKCTDGAITWDTSSEASTQDSNAASASVESAPVPVVAPSVSATTAAAAAAPSASSADGTDAGSAGASAGVQLHVKNGDDGDDDYVCDDDSDDSSSSSSGSSDSTGSAAGTPWADRGKAGSSTAVATPTGAAATADFSAVASTSSSSSSSKAEDVQLFVSSVAPSATTTTTSEAPAQTSAPPSSGGGQVYDGKATYYYQYGVAGSCGVYNSDSVGRDRLGSEGYPTRGPC